MAKDAYKEMTSNFKQYGPKGPNDEYPNHTPMVMTLLAFGNEIILGSSQRGTLAFIDGKAGNPALDNLNLCRILFTEVTSIRPPDVAGEPDMTQHKNTRHCGEVLSMYHFHELHDGEDIGKYEKPRIVSIIRVRNTITKITRLIILDPCGVTPLDEEVSLQPSGRKHAGRVSFIILWPFGTDDISGEMGMQSFPRPAV